MRNTFFAVAAAFALVMSAAPSFAADAAPAAQTKATDAQAEQQHNAGDNKCEEILANKAGHTADEIANCQPKK